MGRTASLILLLVGACGACSGHAPKKDTTPAKATAELAQVPAPPGTANLSEATVAPIWTTPDEQDAAAQFALQNWAAARDAFVRARAAANDDAKIARLELMIGLCFEKLDDAEQASQHLVAAHDKLPLLADYIGYHAARALWLAHHGEPAMALAKSVAKESIVGPDAEILVGDLLHGGTDWAAIVAHYQDYLTRHPDGPFRSEARFNLAEALEKTAADRAAYVKLYKQIEIDDPLSSWNTKAHDRLVALKEPETWTAAEQIARGKVLFDAMRNPESEAAFDAALADPQISAADRCVAAYHKAQSRFKARDRRGAAPMFDDAVTACTAAGNTDLVVKANFTGGKSYSFIGQHDTAIARYQAAGAVDPKHSYNDDALLREAEEWTYLTNGAKVEEVLASLPEKFPDGDNATEAMWRLGWKAWREQRYDDAIKWWKKQVELAKPGASYNGVFGDDERAEAGYWIGRAYAAKKQPADAIKMWADTARAYPAAYYALQSLNRLRETSQKDFDQLVAELQKDPAGFDPKAPVFAFKPRAEWASPGFARAMELLRLGLGEPAEHELRKLGLTASGDKKHITDADQLDKLWAIAWLYDRAGRHASSVWVTRWHAIDYRTQWPVGTDRARWQIAYPKAYWELLTRHAKLNNVPIAMQIGIVREESGFDPLDESYANAIGLTQMIPPTAKDFSKGTGIDPTRENLRDPEKNVTIGSRFLGSLFKTWNNFTLLVPTSYNAGPTAVRRMLKVRGTWDPDEFVEGIVDDQARNYTKRVLGSFFTYTWLYQHEVPEIPNQFPKELLPK